jgi:hypothetical protein
MLEDLFEYIYVNNIWGRQTESKSGPGSSLTYTTNIRQEINHFVAENDVKTFFDAPCGDFNWISAVEFPPSVSYIGGDISPSLISDVKRGYSSDVRSFRVFNITSDVFPKADVWFCRDCLFHMPNQDILSAFAMFAASEIPLVFTTTHVNAVGFHNTDVALGGFRLLDLFAPPFELPRDVLFWAADGVFPHPRREMCVWTRQQVIAALPRMSARILAAS